MNNLSKLQSMTEREFLMCYVVTSPIVAHHMIDLTINPEVDGKDILYKGEYSECYSFLARKGKRAWCIVERYDIDCYRIKMYGRAVFQ